MATDIYFGSATWTATATSVQAECVGGGEAGQNGLGIGLSGGNGSAGGGYGKTVSITCILGNNYTVNVGVGGASNGAVGDASYFSDPGIVKGIGGGVDDVNVGDVTHNGGGGSSGDLAGGGGGAGGAGSTGSGAAGNAGAPGSDGAGGAGGTGTLVIGGPGGGGGALSDGSSGTQPGGGGGGGGPVNLGGVGADGIVVLIYTPSALPPVANFTGTPLSGPQGTTIAFTDSTTNTPTSWAWNFGDGTTSTSQNPSHTYTRPGVYTVVLLATNASGSDTKTRTSYVNVVAAGGTRTQNNFARAGRVKRRLR